MMDWGQWCWGFGWADLMGDFQCHRRSPDRRRRSGFHWIADWTWPYGSGFGAVKEADVRCRACRILWRLISAGESALESRRYWCCT
jgi:hypothetical protein